MDIPANDHTEVIDAAVEPTCTEPGKTEGKHCSVCNAILVAQTEIPAKGHTWTAASCTEPRTCSVCSATDGDPLGHDWSDWTVTTEATCTAKGEKTRSCQRDGCDATETVDIPANGHTEVIDAAVEPTCTVAGKTEGKHCSVCNEILAAQTEVPAKGHDYVNGVCSRCGASEATGEFTVSFVDFDNSIIATQKVAAGKDASLPANPTRDGYYFAGWEGEYQNITADQTVTAKYVSETADNILLMQSADGKAGEEIKIMFSLEGTVKLCQFQMELKFDPSILSIVDIDTDFGLDITSNWLQDEGRILLNFSRTTDRKKRADIMEITLKINEGVTATDAIIALQKMVKLSSVDNATGEVTEAPYSFVDGIIHIS